MGSPKYIWINLSEGAKIEQCFRNSRLSMIPSPPQKKVPGEGLREGGNLNGEVVVQS